MGSVNRPLVQLLDELLSKKPGAIHLTSRELLWEGMAAVPTDPIPEIEESCLGFKKPFESRER